MVNRDRVTGKDIEENENYVFDMKKDLFFEEELATILK